MNAWIVGNHPVGHRILDYTLGRDSKKDGGNQAEEKGLAKTRTLGEKVFFMKARIMAGQADLAQNQFGLKDYKWLVREELETQVERSYWHSIKNMLPAR
jgi:large subunit ribosomal protein L46